ncbi:MAG: hypothetical protein ACOZIN_20700 [Myxococcota bacterium]
MRRLALTLVFGLWGCSAPPAEDAGTPVEDAGLPEDGGVDGGEAFDAGPSIDAGFGAVPIEEWCASKGWAECARQVRCLLLDPAHFDACLLRQKLSCDQSAYTSATEGNRLQYLSDQAGRCLNAYAQGSCEGAPADCEGVFQGLVPPDGGCLLPEECNAQGHCFPYTNTCPLFCYRYRQLGEPCDTFSQLCEPGVGTCQTDGGVEFCAPPKGEGEACSYGECRAGLTCYNSSSGSQCVRLYAQVGETCASSGPYPLCESDAFCRQAPAPPGGTAPPGTCQKRAGLGGVCTGPGSCLPNLRCSGTYQTGTCIPKGKEGEPCTGFGDCQEELFCLARNSRCTALPTDGGDCTSQGSYFDCAASHYCDFSAPNQAYTCAPRRANGELCSYASMCQSNHCEWGPNPDGGAGNLYSCHAPCSQRVDGGF